MANLYIEIPNLCPLNFVDANRALPANYHFKHFDAWKASEQLLSFEMAPAYKQKWQKNDVIIIPAKANLSPINIFFYNEDGFEQYSTGMTDVGVVGDDTYWRASISLADFPEGCYTVKLIAGEGDNKIELEAEKILVKESHEDTLLFKYSNSFNNQVFWEGVSYITLRVEGAISEYTPIGTRVVYTDQPNNAKTVKGTSARQFKLYVGGPEGVPNFIADKIQDIFDQNSVEIDGKGFSALNDGAKLSAKREEFYGFSGWSLDITETVNRRAKRFEIEGLIDKKVTIDYIVEGKLFGPIDGNANDNTYYIKDIE